MNLGFLAKHLNGELHGSPDFKITGVCDIFNLSAGKISFVLDTKYSSLAHASQDTAFVTPKFDSKLMNQIVVKNSKKALAQALQLFYPDQEPEWRIESPVMIHESVSFPDTISIDAFSRIDEGTVLGERCRIGSSVSIGKNCKIGDGCILHPGVVLHDGVKLGNNVVIGANTSIGIDGFGFYQDEGQWHRLPHIGTVIIEDNVQIAALNCIARGCIGDTIIQENTIIDTLNHFAHNCHIGKNVAITASNVFAGSVTIKDNVQISGQVAVNPQTTVGTNTVLMARSELRKISRIIRLFQGFQLLIIKLN